MGVRRSMSPDKVTCPHCLDMAALAMDCVPPVQGEDVSSRAPAASGRERRALNARCAAVERRCPLPAVRRPHTGCQTAAWAVQCLPPCLVATACPGPALSSAHSVILCAGTCSCWRAGRRALVWPSSLACPARRMRPWSRAGPARRSPSSSSSRPARRALHRHACCVRGIGALGHAQGHTWPVCQNLGSPRAWLRSYRDTWSSGQPLPAQAGI